MPLRPNCRLGVIVIATNKYISYVPDLLASMRKHFNLGRVPICYFVLTNDRTFDGGHDVTTVHHAHSPWPSPTLHRYRAFLRNADRFAECSHLLYCDADMRFVGTVGPELLVPKGQLFGALSPGFSDPDIIRWLKKHWNVATTITPSGTPEVRRGSTAAILPFGSNPRYYCGAVQGGAKDAYLAAAKTMAANIDVDTANGVVAKHHDESHWNWLLWKTPPHTTLDSGFCYSVGLPWTHLLKTTPRILALDKPAEFDADKFARV